MNSNSTVKTRGQEADLVLGIAKDVVFGSNGSILQLVEKDGIDWQSFRSSISYHGLAPFAYTSLKGYLSILPQALSKTLEATYYYSMAHISGLQQKFLEIYDAFENKGIDFISIKGVALLEDLYPEYPVRSSTDVDVLVKEKDLDKAIKILEGQGYSKNLEGLKESYWRNKQYHFVFVRDKKKGFSPIVELHWDLDYPRYRRRILPQMFDRLRQADMQDIKVKLLSAEDTFFGLALHQRRFGIALSLRDVCDTARLLNKYKSSFDWDYVLNESKRAKVCSAVFFALCQVKLFFSIDAPEYVWEGLNVSRWKRRMIQRFIDKNTFSQDINSKNLYLKAHFLLYDNLWEPVDYILNIPQEQFAKFYGLSAYDKKTSLFYRYRLCYIFLKTLLNLIYSIKRRNS